MPNNRDWAPIYYNMRECLEHPLNLQVTWNINVQLMVSLLVLGKLLGKPQWTRHLLIKCKYRVNQVSGTTYLTFMIMSDFWTPVTHHTSLSWLVKPTPVARIVKLSFAPMEFLLVLIIAVMLPCHISSRNMWGTLEKDGELSMDLRVQMCTRFMRALLLGPPMMIPFILIRYKYPTIYMLPKERK